MGKIKAGNFVPTGRAEHVKEAAFAEAVADRHPDGISHYAPGPAVAFAMARQARQLENNSIE